MNKNPEISIIMAVYNAFNYLDDSMKAILNQSFANFELLCIDDCSDDGVTNTLLESYRQKDERVHVYRLNHRTNCGYARNVGMTYAKGKYVIFVDADDVMSVYQLEYMYEAIHNEEADICVCSTQTFDSETGQILNINKPQILSSSNTRYFNIYDLGERAFCLWHTAVWNKMYRTTFLKDNNIIFQSLSSLEDCIHSILSIMLARKIVLCKGGEPILYSYRTSHIDHISANKDPFNLIYAMQALFSIREIKPGSIEYTQVIYYFLTHCIAELRACKDINKRINFYNAVKSLCKTIINRTNVGAEGKKYYDFFISLEYETLWFESKLDYYNQISMHTNILTNLFNQYTYLVVWGIGKRGQAFKRWWQTRSTIELFFTDSNAKKLTDNKNVEKILTPDETLNMPSCIIASNHLVYDYLISNYPKIHHRVVDLEIFCPF